MLEVERELLCPPVELPSPRASVHTSLHTLARKVPRGERFAGDHVYWPVAEDGGGGKKQKCAKNVEINVTVIFYEEHTEDHADGGSAAARAKPMRALPASKTVKYLERKTSPMIHNGPAGGGMSIAETPSKQAALPKASTLKT